jgi:DeoR/GlpR family transcriptional regulator of sugar metabolism
VVAVSFALIRQTLLKSSNLVYLIADRSKFNKTSFVHICDYEDINAIVSDYDFTAEWRDFLQHKNVNIYECNS